MRVEGGRGGKTRAAPWRAALVDGGVGGGIATAVMSLALLGARRAVDLAT